MSNNQESNKRKKDGEDDDDDDEDVPLPGFRFHPTDEELVGFYLRRKVDKIPISLELIKQVDIYKYDPWDLPKSSSGEDAEGYFFCKRGRKYRNSVRPNRVTRSGFWKATGIDKQVYSAGGEGRDCIGLKKTLVYYRGSAGKGTKTEWMMHEFRLPNNDNTSTAAAAAAAAATTCNNLANAENSGQEAEVWTLCRIFRKNLSQRRYTQDWRELWSPVKRQQNLNTTSSIQEFSVDSSSHENYYLSFGGSPPIQQHQHQHRDKKPGVHHHHPVAHNDVNNNNNKQLHGTQLTSSIAHQPVPSMASSSNNISSPYGNEMVTYGGWDELGSVVQFAFDPSPR